MRDLLDDMLKHARSIRRGKTNELIARMNDEPPKPYHYTIDEAVDKLIKLNKLSLERTGESMPPGAVLVGCTGRNDIFAEVPQLGDPKFKERCGQTISDLAAEHQAQAVVLCIDGWYINAPIEQHGCPKCHNTNGERIGKTGFRYRCSFCSTEYDATEGLPQPSKHPNRKEALVVSVIHPDGSCTLRMLPYERKGGKVIWTDLADADSSHTEQRLVPAWAPRLA